MSNVVCRQRFVSDSCLSLRTTGKYCIRMMFCAPCMCVCTRASQSDYTGVCAAVCMYVSASTRPSAFRICLQSVYYIRYSTSFSHHIFLCRSIPLTPDKTIIAPPSLTPSLPLLLTSPGNEQGGGRERGMRKEGRME